MLFKKLEVCGFKSFPELVELKFDKGVTVIVGPNGCGKTNILDSIRWVLGEQSSRMMRGKEMLDLIFNGGSNKKPKGMAEVSLTLLDTEGVLPTEYSEVTITRRLFRSGESEYLLNRNTCRLKDIQELFMDTGLGADAYSIIEQSQTDLILSNNPSMRRSLFEEAAGITKYKARKRETLRKLETTEQNLLRIYDIVAEIKRQMNSLKRQAGRAERYKKFLDECQGLELKLDSFYFYDMDEKRSKYKQDLTVCQDEREGVLAHISTYEAEIEKLDLQAMQLGDKLSSIHESRKNFYENVENLTKEIAEMEERLKGKDFRGKMLAKEVEEDELRLKDLERDLLEKQDEISALDDLMIVWEEEFEVLAKDREDVEIKSKEAESFLKEKESNLDNVETRIWEKNKLKQDLEKRQQEAAASKENLINLIEGTKVKVENLQKDLDEKKEILKASRNNIESLRNKLEELRQELIKNQELLQKVMPSINDTYNEVAKLDYKIKMLEQLEKEAIGYSRGVKELMQAEKDGKIKKDGVFAPLVSKINISEEYKTALESALGEGINYFLAETVDKINECINYLYNEGKGKAAFLNMDNFKKMEYPNSGLPAPENSRLLLDLVDVDENLRPIVSYLLKGVFIVDSDISIEMLEKLPPEVKIVAKNGKIFSRELIAGGKDSAESVSIIGREKNINILKEKIGELRKHLEIKTQEKENIDKRQLEIQSLINELNDEIKAKEYNFIENERLVMKLELESNQLITENIGRETSVKEIESRLESVIKEFEDIKFDIESLLEEKEKRSSDLEEMRGQYRILEQKKDSLMSLGNEKKVNLASVKEKKTACLDLEKRINDIIADSKDKILTKSSEIALIKKTTYEETVYFEEKRKTLEHAKNENNKESFDRDGIEKLEKELRLNAKQLEERVKEERHKLRTLEENIAGLQIKETELRVQEDNLRQKMQNVYKFSFQDDSRPPKEEIENLEEVTLRIENLHSEMNQMGLVNMMALEEYKEIEERYNFLSNQQKDLEDAKNNLNDTISKINKESIERFRATFDKIRENFAQVFAKFFKGGRADIVLTENDILESNIEIIAQPPGKKPESIQLLSGGERALTAIGLLLSIFMVKPSPFLILDEVDAPLDDPNVRRFTEVIREFAKNTQFIVITHNKRTMEMADCLYGVTMEEPGVSKLVSVNFKKEERTPDPIIVKDGTGENSGAEENAKDNIAAAVEAGAVETKAS
ncbi:MAG: chromosome segregation protein SMC [bacterium]|nr:chromosome segregation protein SMC [bacterium]